MAYLRIPDEAKEVCGFEEIRSYLSEIGIDYGTWKAEYPLSNAPSQEEILEAYKKEIDILKKEGGYVTADVISVDESTQGLDEMLAKFDKEHWHDEDEIRFIIDGNGVFHIRPEQGAVVALEVEAGDFIRVPSKTLHWFNLCKDKKIKAIRLFQDPSGWTPHYTNSGHDQSFLQVCMGPSFIPVGEVRV